MGKGEAGRGLPGRLKSRQFPKINVKAYRRRMKTFQSRAAGPPRIERQCICNAQDNASALPVFTRLHSGVPGKPAQMLDTSAK
jgi:hypothetical protein